MGLTDPSGDYVYAMDRVGQGMRARGLGSFPSRLRDTRGALWDRPYGRSVNYYLRRPRTGTMLREFMNSEAVDWGAVRSNTPAEIGQLGVTEGEIFYDCLQRWHIHEDFEAYGMMMPFLGIEGGPDGPYQLRVKLALFQSFPYVHEYQTWKILPGAKFLLDATVENTSGASLQRKLFIPFENRTQGTLVIPAGLYYLFIMPDNPFEFTMSVYIRTVRDYVNDTALVWRADRYRSFSPTVDFDTYDYADLVFQNDGSAPPIGTVYSPAPSSSQPWFDIDFSFLGRFV